MVNIIRLTVHHFLSANNLAAECFTNRLMSKAHTEDWNFASTITNDGHADAGILRGAGAGAHGLRLTGGGSAVRSEGLVPRHKVVVAQPHPRAAELGFVGSVQTIHTGVIRDAFGAMLVFLEALATGILRGSADPTHRLATNAANAIGSVMRLEMFLLSGTTFRQSGNRP